MACLRSPRRPADAARLTTRLHGPAGLIVSAVVSIGGCEAIFSGPLHENAGGESTGAQELDSGGDQNLTSGGDTGPADDTAAGEVDVDGGSVFFDLGGDTSGTPPPAHNDGDCCTAAKGIGCADEMVEACVCDVDPACCEKGWDELCVVRVEQLGCGGCTVGPTGTRDSAQDCCLPHDEPGCIDMDIAACVCTSDPFCCMVGWDQLCVDKVVELGCDDCIEPLGPVDLDCCVEHQEPGCDDPDVMACVCEQDAFCCDTAWDGLCVGEVDGLLCGECYPQGTTGDASMTGESGGTDPGTSSSGS